VFYIAKNRRGCAMRNISIHGQLSCLVNGNAFYRLFHRPGNACFQRKFRAIRHRIRDLHLAGSARSDFNRADAAFCSAQSSALDAGFCAEHALVKNALEKTTQSIIRE